MQYNLEELYEEAIRQIEEEERLRFQTKRQTGFRKYIRKHIKRDYIFEVIKERNKIITPPKPFEYKKPPTNKKKETLVLMLGDMHLGSVSKKGYLNGLGEFNKNVFKDSLEVLLSKVVEVIRERRKIRHIEKLHIFLLGDLVDGENIFSGHAHEVDLTIIDQVLEGAALISNAIASLSKEVPQIEVNCVAGNHGRISHEAPVEDNWERLLYELIKKDLSQCKTIKVNAGKEFFRIVNIYNHRFMIVHGHELRSLTSTGLERLVTRYTQITRGGFDYLCMGHHHRHVQYEFNCIEAIVNPPFVNSSHYGLAKLALQSSPGQLLLGVDPEDGVRWKDKIPLWDSKK